MNYPDFSQCTLPIILLLLNRICHENEEEKEMPEESHAGNAKAKWSGKVKKKGISQSNAKKQMKAQSMLKAINYEFLFCLYFMCEALTEVKMVPDYLQKPDADLGHACMLISNLIDSLSEYRNDDTKFATLVEKVKMVAEECNIHMERKDKKRLKKLPKKFADYITEVGSAEQERIRITSEDDLRIKIFYPCIDNMICELKSRFSDNNDILIGLNYLNPKCDTFLDFEKLKKAGEHYNLDTELLEMEVKLVKKTVRSYELEKNCLINSAIKFHKFLTEYKLAFSTLAKLSSIFLTIPPSTAGVERSFSSLRLIKTYLRTTMSDERLSSIAVLSIEKELSKSININEVVDIFAARHKNRRILLV